MSSRPQEQMGRGEKAFFHLSNGLVVATGAAYAWMLYGLEPMDPYAVWNHPWQGWVHDLHLLAVPLLLLAAGMLWKQHAAPRLRQPKRRAWGSGLALLLLLGPMTWSGVMLQVAVEEVAWSNWRMLHWISSGLWTFSGLLHWLQGRVRSRRQGRSA